MNDDVEKNDSTTENKFSAAHTSKISNEEMNIRIGQPTKHLSVNR
jgi:hypothetical protein